MSMKPADCPWSACATNVSFSAARSGLAPYTPEAGVSVVRVSLGAQYQFSGQWFAGLRIAAAQLQGDATDSPIVQDKNQNLYALFVGYRF